MSRRRPLFLLGFPGSGKSTLCRGLRRLRPDVVTFDLDAVIEQRAGMTVSEFFARHGEDAFRDFESATLKALVEENADVAAGVVIACGGGTPCFNDNMQLMNSLGETVMLDVAPEVLFSRLKRGRAKRPLIASLSDEGLRDYIAGTMARRSPFYDRALSRFNATLLENEDEIETTLSRFIAQYDI